MNEHKLFLIFTQEDHNHWQILLKGAYESGVISSDQIIYLSSLLWLVNYEEINQNLNPYKN